MNKIFFILLIISNFISYGQNVSLEISDWVKKIDGKNYSTFQFARSSYSSSRATMIFITDIKTLKLTYLELAKIFKSRKQEITDVWILGIENFDNENLSEIDKKIITEFNQQILKYRAYYNLPQYSEERLNDERIHLKNKSDICKYLSCSNKIF